MSERGDRNQENDERNDSVGHETDSLFARMMDERAEEDGAAGLPDELTTAEDSPPVQMAREAAKARIGVFKARFAEDRTPMRRKVAEGPSRMRQKLAGVAVQATAATTLERRLRECRADLPHLAGQRAAAESEIAEIPFYRRGLVSVWVLLAVLGAVAVFDGAVLKGALEQTTLDSASIWLTTIGVAAVIAAINEAFGLLLGVVIRRAGRRRLLVIVGILAVGLAGLFVSIAMLGWFRHEVAASQNRSLSAIAGGHNASFDFIIDPLFLAPLQAAGCLAAMAVVALYALSSDWRAARDRLRDATILVELNDADMLSLEEQIATALETGRTSFTQAFDAEADACAAGAGIASSIEQEQAMVEGESALGEEMVARYRGRRNSTKRIYENGKVQRAARPTEFGRRSTHTPDACDVNVGEPDANGNGHAEDVDPMQLFFGGEGR